MQYFLHINLAWSDVGYFHDLEIASRRKNTLYSLNKLAFDKACGKGHCTARRLLS